MKDQSDVADTGEAQFELKGCSLCQSRSKSRFAPPAIHFSTNILRTEIKISGKKIWIIWTMRILLRTWLYFYTFLMPIHVRRTAKCHSSVSFEICDSWGFPRSTKQKKISRVLFNSNAYLFPTYLNTTTFACTVEVEMARYREVDRFLDSRYWFTPAPDPSPPVTL